MKKEATSQKGPHSIYLQHIIRNFLCAQLIHKQYLIQILFIPQMQGIQENQSFFYNIVGMKEH